MSGIRKENWIECELGAVGNFVGGGTPFKRNSEYRNGKITWVSIKDIKGDFLLKTQEFLTEIGVKESPSCIGTRKKRFSPNYGARATG
jgi:type I restriction enzyme, S subunit